MQYGYFDDKAREYVITRPDTPLPWINYLGSRDFYSLISNTGGGYCINKDARLRRITRYRCNNAPLDMGGRCLYLRDDENGRHWSVGWMPELSQQDAHECCHGLGDTRIQSKSMGIDARVRFFVPLDAPKEIWDLTLRNQRETPTEISLFSAFQLSPARKLMLKYGWACRRLSVAAVRRVGTRPEMAG